MLVTPRLYAQYANAQRPILAVRPQNPAEDQPVSWSSLPPDVERYVKTMLLVHQTGNVHVGEVVRYTLTYSPARDRVRPVPTCLHVRVRNTCAIALRAAYLHGPYTLYTACYPDKFNPNVKYDSETYGEPQFEPMLKAGGSWAATLKVPEALREECEEMSSNGEAPGSCTWIIECTSQVLFSTTAKVHYEVIVGRDEQSVQVGFAGLTGSINSTPGRLIDHQESSRKPGNRPGPMKGVFSNAVSVVVDDTASLWNKPPLPGLDHSAWHELQVPKKPRDNSENPPSQNSESSDESRAPPKKRKVHLVVITHGLHSNLGADMLYMKESIDAAAKQARIDARQRKKVELTKVHSNPIHDYTSQSPPPPEAKQAKAPATSTAPLSGGQEDIEDEPEEDEEEVVVRGFSGNAVRTERGIQYLGKRLAKYVLGMTYPDQPYLPVKKSFRKTLTRTFTSREKIEAKDGHAAHQHSSVMEGGQAFPLVDRPYEVTSISFIGHSLGGLTQTYAIAYIHKHSPDFFKRIRPVNFIALASPFLGLNNENPLYVKFALDFGLVGRTGQDLGLTWRPPTVVRNGWAGMIAGIGTEKQRVPKKVDPGTKPLLRLLPSGPAHTALKLFRNRTVYSNVVNDGIVPLRTSCLLFLDWRGLGRVEKARRENGLIGTMAGWGWAEITGTNQTEHRSQWPWSKQDGSEGTDDESEEAPLGGKGDTVPQPADDATKADNASLRQNIKSAEDDDRGRHSRNASLNQPPKSPTADDRSSSPLAGFMSLFGGGSAKEKKEEPKPKLRPRLYTDRLIRRAQTVKLAEDSSQSPSPATPATPSVSASGQGPSENNFTTDDPEDVFAPPKTSVFEAAGDLLNPPIPTLDFLIDPLNRPRTIFHDRVYHPEDVPPPPARRKSLFRRRISETGKRHFSKDSTASHTLGEVDDVPTTPTSTVSTSDAGSSAETVGSMPVEEKIARAYHWDLSWRKVLVRLSPDAHNNIVVRRMFANAYGWPVVKHLVDTHFADTHAAMTADRLEDNVERARPMTEPANEQGDEVKEQRRRMSGEEDDERDQMYREASDELAELKDTNNAVGSLSSSVTGQAKKIALERQDSAGSTAWADRLFEGADDDESDTEGDYALEGFAGWQKRKDEQAAGPGTPKGTSREEVDDFLHGKGKSKDQTAATSPRSEHRPTSSGNLLLPIENVTQSPQPITPLPGLGQTLSNKLNLEDRSQTIDDKERHEGRTDPTVDILPPENH